MLWFSGSVISSRSKNSGQLKARVSLRPGTVKNCQYSASSGARSPRSTAAWNRGFSAQSPWPSVAAPSKFSGLGVPGAPLASQRNCQKRSKFTPPTR